MKNTVLLELGVLVEVDKSELIKEFGELDSILKKLEKSIQHTLDYTEDSELGLLSSRPIILDEMSMNCGKCHTCGTWTSDKKKEGFIPLLTIGTCINGKLYCDLCLPEDHPLAF